MFKKLYDDTGRKYFYRDKDGFHSVSFFADVRKSAGNRIIKDKACKQAIVNQRDTVQTDALYPRFEP